MERDYELTPEPWTPEDIMSIVNSELPEIKSEVIPDRFIEPEEWRKIRESAVVPEDRVIPEVELPASHQLLREQMRQILSSLTEREHKVLAMRFGLVDGRSSTQKQVGEAIGRSVRTVGRIEKTALRKLRHPSRSRASLKDFLE